MAMKTKLGLIECGRVHLYHSSLWSQQCSPGHDAVLWSSLSSGQWAILATPLLENHSPLGVHSIFLQQILAILCYLPPAQLIFPRGSTSHPILCSLFSLSWSHTPTLICQSHRTQQVWTQHTAVSLWPSTHIFSRIFSYNCLGSFYSLIFTATVWYFVHITSALS